jgi:hypothetical protein
MQDTHNTQSDQRPHRDEFLFVVHNAATRHTQSPRTIAAHARIRQVDRKHRDRRRGARQDAQYARSLVGWRTRDQEQGATASPAEPGLSWSLQPTGGLRVDPFNALPVQQDRDVMYTTDYCESNIPQRRRYVHAKTSQLMVLQSFRYGRCRRPVATTSCSDITRIKPSAGRSHSKMTWSSMPPSQSADLHGV